MTSKMKNEMSKFTEWMKAVDEIGFNQQWKQIQEIGKELRECGYTLQFIIPGLKPNIKKMSTFEKIKYKILRGKMGKWSNV